MSETYPMLIDGALVESDERLSVVNPADGAVFADAPDCSREQLDAAVAAARRALPGWRATSFDDRRKALLAMAGVLAANADELKRLLTREQGKPHDDAAGDVLGGAHWLAETSKLELPVSTSEDSAERLAVTRHVPVGVVAAIVPWNFPILLAMFKLAPALLAGNTVVLKPAPTTPLTTLRLGALFKDVLPPGVLNVISGGDRLGPWLTSHPGVDKVSFTGSTATGRKVMESAASSLKRITLELGGNDAAIVMPDVDVDAVAPQLFWAAFRNAGQICIATKRMYVHADIYDRLRDALAAYAATVKVGDGSEQGTQIGPIQNAAQHARVQDLIADSRAAGYRVIGEERIEGDGFFIPVTIVDNPPDDARIVVEEQFGPVLPLLKFHDLDDAVARANASEYGLGASVWTADLERAQGIADRLAAGAVWINESQHLSPHAAFGGQKQSGLGVEGGAEGLLEFTVHQTVFMRKAA